MVAGQPVEEEGSPSRSAVTALVYVSLLLDNILLSAVVPILPAYLSERDGMVPGSTAATADAAHTAQTLLFAHIFSNLSRAGDGRPVIRSRTSALPAYFPDRRDDDRDAPTPPAHCSHVPARPNCTSENAGGGRASSSPTAAPGPAGTSIGPRPTSSSSPLTLTSPGPDLSGPDLAPKTDGRIGVLLSSKAFVQLLVNAGVGTAIARIGFRLPLVFGVGILALSSFLFAVSSGTSGLLMARAIHGLGSSCIAVAGLSTVADLYPNERERSRVMGRVLGAMAVGVLIGYPFGGLSYDLMGKSPPFWMLAVLLVCVCAGQYRQLQPLPLSRPDEEEDGEEPSASWWPLLSDRRVCIVAGSVGISTSVMAILEPTLPEWLIRTIHPQKWQLGSVFIPDSLGYLIGTHGFGVIALRLGRWRTAAAAMMTVGAAALLLPQSTRMVHLVLPHFCIGLGIGMVDASLMPLLARLVERHGLQTAYGTVYAVSQTAVCLAYSVGPFLGGYLSSAIGFRWLLAILGTLNLLYTPCLVLLREPPPSQRGEMTGDGQAAPMTGPAAGYKRAPPLGSFAGSTFSYTQFSEC